MKPILRKDVLNFASKMPSPYKISSIPLTKEYVMEMLKVLQQQIPKGLYCYDEKGWCPFWELLDNKVEQENGYCHYLKLGNLDDISGMLLKDRRKNCGINQDLEVLEDL